VAGYARWQAAAAGRGSGACFEAMVLPGAPTGAEAVGPAAEAVPGAAGEAGSGG